MSTAASDDAIVLIYATTPDEATAHTIAEALIEAHLIACANVLPGMSSLYRWGNKIARDREVVLILKTRADLAEPAIAAARTLHPFATPAFVVLPTTGGSHAFLDWIREETLHAKPAAR